MQEHLHLGTIGRTRVGMHWSVVVIVAAIAFILATGVLPAAASGFSTGAYWVVAFLAAGLFLASLLGHELSHAVVARRKGVLVDGIVLWALGGVAKLHGDAPDAGSELQIAIAGPVASVVLAGVFGLLAFGLSALGASVLLVTALVWIAEMNALLAVFNLLPAYPLDGGRVLRAGLWRYWGDRLRATDAAAGAGRFIGSALIGLGIVAALFFPALSLDGIWLALIGWFVVSASRQEQGAVRVTSMLGGLRVGDVMYPVAAVAPAYATLEDLVDEYLRPGHLDRCPLVDINGAVAGLLTVNQLGRVSPELWRTTRTSDIAWPTASLAQTTPGSALVPFVGQVASTPSHCGLVFEDGRLVGTVTPSDVERALHAPSALRSQSDESSATVSGP